MSGFLFSGGEKGRNLLEKVFCVCTVCPRSGDPLDIVSYYIELAKASWTDSICNLGAKNAVYINGIVIYMPFIDVIRYASIEFKKKIIAGKNH